MTAVFGVRPEPEPLPEPMFDGVFINENSEEIVAFLVARSAEEIKLSYYRPHHSLSTVSFLPKGATPFGRVDAMHGSWILYDRATGAYGIKSDSYVRSALQELEVSDQ